MNRFGLDRGAIPIFQKTRKGKMAPRAFKSFLAVQIRFLSMRYSVYQTFRSNVPWWLASGSGKITFFESRAKQRERRETEGMGFGRFSSISSERASEIRLLNRF